MEMSDGLIAVGPPPLTEVAADCSIDVIDFMAAAVRGIDAIDVTPAMRQAWRAHLAAYYPMLAPVDRFWFANAPATLAAIQAGWQQLPEPQRALYRQTWAMALPALLQFAGPVLNGAASAPQPVAASPQPGPVRDTFVHDLINTLVSAGGRELERQATNVVSELVGQPTAYNEQVNNQMLINMSNMGYTSTVDLMNAYSGMS